MYAQQIINEIDENSIYELGNIFGATADTGTVLGSTLISLIRQWGEHTDEEWGWTTNGPGDVLDEYGIIVATHIGTSVRYNVAEHLGSEGLAVYRRIGDSVNELPGVINVDEDGFHTVDHQSGDVVINYIAKQIQINE